MFHQIFPHDVRFSSESEGQAALEKVRFVVGARIGDVGIVDEMEGRQPMIQFLASKPDAL